MRSPKYYNTKNLAMLVQELSQAGQDKLALKLLERKELKNLIPNIASILERKLAKEKKYNKTFVYSAKDIPKNLVAALLQKVQADDKDVEIVIDENLSAGVRIRSKDISIDATLETILKKLIAKIIQKYK